MSRRGVRDTQGLIIKDAHHIPGYTGHVPGRKFEFGDPFGQTTYRLLKDSPARGRAELPSIPPPRRRDSRGADRHCGTHERPVPATRPALYKDALRSPGYGGGAPDLATTRVPGYTGYLPQREEFFGERYAQTTRSAIDRHSTNRSQKFSSTARLRGDVATARPLTTSGADNPFKTRPYVPQSDPGYTRSAFSLPREHKDRQFIPGYSGHVPRVSQLHGQSFGRTTRQALDHHTDLQATERPHRTAPPGTGRSQRGRTPWQA